MQSREGTLSSATAQQRASEQAAEAKWHLSMLTDHAPPLDASHLLPREVPCRRAQWHLSHHPLLQSCCVVRHRQPECVRRCEAW